MNESRIDLRPEHLNLVKQILRRYVPAYTVWAFGSRVSGKAKPYSDLDLVIVSEQSLSFRLQAQLEDAFSESDLPFRVDVVDWARTSEFFRKIIQSQYLVLQG